VPQSSYVEIPDAPHNVYYEAAAPYNAAVADFLTNLRQ
jgi:pimeloyl-ACP methyl ester carboxylesterase